MALLKEVIENNGRSAEEESEEEKAERIFFDEGFIRNELQETDVHHFLAGAGDLGNEKDVFRNYAKMLDVDMKTVMYFVYQPKVVGWYAICHEVKCCMRACYLMLDILEKKCENIGIIPPKRTFADIDIFHPQPRINPCLPFENQLVAAVNIVREIVVLIGVYINSFKRVYFNMN